MRGLNADDLERMERVLIEADFGVPATVELTQALEDEVRRGKLKTEGDLRRALEGRLAAPCSTAGQHPGAIARNPDGPTVILMVGVNGTGKTTTAAKLARRLQREGRKVLLAAADTYRAGAIAQLQVWAERLGIPCVAGEPGGDPAAVAFDAIDAAVSRGLDTVIVDTAGRLHTQEGLMDELRKVVRVVGPPAARRAPRDAAGARRHRGPERGPAGQALRARRCSPTGIVVTKLDGSARGGAVDGAPARARPADPVPRRRRGARRPSAVRSRAIRAAPAGRVRVIARASCGQFTRRTRQRLSCPSWLRACSRTMPQ